MPLSPYRQDGGAALLVALVAALLLAGIGAGLVSMSSTERAVAANFGAVYHGWLAADAALARALVDVRRAASLDDLLTGAVRSTFG